MKSCGAIVAVGATLIGLSATGSHAQVCSPHELDLHLSFCRTDTGHNEGASCGASVLGYQIGPLIGVGAGEIFKRNHMTSLASAAAKAGATEQAFQGMMCCQVHNPIGAACFQSYKPQVIYWLQTN